MNKKILKFLILGAGLILLSVLVRWLDITIPPSFKYSDKFDLNKKVQSFNIDLPKGAYRLGFAIGKQDLIGKKNDGKYLLEYYCGQKLVKKTYNIGNENQNVFYDAPNMYYLLFIDQLNIPDDISCKKFTLKITTEKNFSLFKDLNISNPVTFYIRKKGKYLTTLEKNLKISTTNFKKKYPRDFKNSPVDVFYDDNATHTAIIDALSQKNLQAFKRLLHQHNLNVSIKMGYDKNGKFTKRTPIIYATYFNDLPILKYLLNHGAEIDYEDYITKTPLQYAIENNSTVVVKYLLDHGADKKKACFVDKYKNDRGYLTPLAFAIKNEYYELFKILLEHGFRKIDLNCKGINIGDDDAFANALAKTDNHRKKKAKHDLGPFKRDPKFHIYSYLYDMLHPVRFLKLYKKYGLKDKKYEKDHTKEWFINDYKECTDTPVYGGRCIYIRENNVTLKKYDIYKFFEIIGYANRQKRSK